MFTE
ncbi:hypothetical protein D030_0132, partial [Vibrio parahaemolyticus AQ3810]|jgi:DNA replication licensing factor MCM4